MINYAVQYFFHVAMLHFVQDNSLTHVVTGLMATLGSEKLWFSVSKLGGNCWHHIFTHLMYSLLYVLSIFFMYLHNLTYDCNKFLNIT